MAQKSKPMFLVKKALHRSELKKLLHSVDKHIDDLMDAIENNETQSNEPSFKIPEDFATKLKDKKKIKETIRNKLRKLDEANTDRLSEVDPDARMMKSGRNVDFCYNGQAVVDEKQGILVGIDIINDASDNHMLDTMLDHVEEIMGETAEETLADGGYLSGDDLQKAADKNREVLVGIGNLINSPRKPLENEFDINHFVHDPSKNIYTCPKGGILTFRRYKHHKSKSYSVKVYRCKDYKECPYRNQCSRDPRGRSIEIHPNRGVIDSQIKKHEQPEMKALYKRRIELVEKVFGEIKHNRGFRRWMYRGLESVRAQWSLICTAYNLRKIHQVWLKCPS